jgi:cell division protein FtsN
MRTVQVLEEEQEATGSDAEFSLGMGSLIGIFFGLALVCGVFFGFGYMMGHRSPGPYLSSEPLYESPKPAVPTTAPKPSAQFPEQPAEASRVVLPSAPSPETSPEINETTDQAPASPLPSKAASAQPVARPQLAASSTPAVSAPSRPGPEATGTIMVQIAAVKNRTDAEALAAALRKNGFNPAIRSESQDKLLHVQVGPFARHEDAKAMRQKLSSAGYNAFIK